MSRSILLAALWFASSLVPQLSESAERVALVIGNSNYGGEAALRNPANDADVMEATLKGLDFVVIKRKDLNLAQMEDALVAFRRALTKGGLGLFFYAGHGMQVKGENFLVPIGARLREEFEVKRECLQVEHVLEAMDESESNLKVVVIDCCRDNPFERGWKHRSGSGGGLAAMADVPDGTLIAFATAPKKTAADGRGDNSPYTEQLATTLRSRPAEGLEIVDVFRKASRAVKLQTGQKPWMNLEASLPEYYLWRGVGTERPMDAAAHRQQAIVYARQKQFAEALESIDRALELDGTDVGSRLFRGDLYSFELNNARKAIQDYTEAIRIVSESDASLGPPAAVLYHRRGVAQVDLHEYDKAVADFTEAIRRDAQAPKLYLERGNAYRLQSQYQNALLDLNQSIALDGSDPNSYNVRAEVFTALGKLEAAQADRQKANALRRQGNAHSAAGGGDLAPPPDPPDAEVPHPPVLNELPKSAPTSPMEPAADESGAAKSSKKQRNGPEQEAKKKVQRHEG